MVSVAVAIIAAIIAAAADDDDNDDSHPYDNSKTNIVNIAVLYSFLKS